MRVVLVEMINGIQLGIEHVTGDDDEDYENLIALNILCFRFIFMKMKEQQAKKQPPWSNPWGLFSFLEILRCPSTQLFKFI